MVIFGQNASDLHKCQMLTAQRAAYEALAAERARFNAIFADVPLYQSAMNALPINGVPHQLLECAIQMSEVDQYKATRPGPGTIRDPLDAACPSDDASDEHVDDDEQEANPADEAAPASSAQSSTHSQSVDHLNHCAPG